MKSIILIITTCIILGLNPGFAQNRFENINANSVEYIIIKYQEEPGKVESKKITDPENINKIVTFLKNTNFENYKSGDMRPNRENYIFWINLGGWFEKIYFFKDDAFIAKSQFNIDPKVIDQLKIIYINL